MATATKPKKSRAPRSPALEQALVDAIPVKPVTDETRASSAFFLASQDGRKITDLMSEPALEQLSKTVNESLIAKRKADPVRRKAIELEDILQHASEEELLQMGHILGEGGCDNLRHRVSDMIVLCNGHQPLDLYFGEIYIGEDRWFIDHDIHTEAFYTDGGFTDQEPSQCFVLVNREERRITFGGGSSDPAMLGNVIVRLSTEHLKQRQAEDAAEGGAA